MSKQKISELENQVAIIQNEIERIKKEDSEPRMPSKGVYNKYKERLEAARTDLFNLYGEIVHEESIHSLTTYVSVGRFSDNRIGMLCCGTGSFSSLDELNEEGLSAALDVYTNPRRITILKELVKGEMTASEISRRTGLQSGQLYHHLSILESAKLIVKTADKYSADTKTQGILCGLCSVVGGMDIANS
jgi:predicted transcriptional regulator